MKTFKLLLAAAALALFAIACGSTDNRATVNTNARPSASATPAAGAAPTPDELAAAAADFARFCVNCHKADGTGGPFVLEDGTKLKVPNLREHGRRDPDKHLTDQIVAGGDGMPAFRDRLDEQRINALVRYIRREFHGQTNNATNGGATTAPAAPSH